MNVNGEKEEKKAPAKTAPVKMDNTITGMIHKMKDQFAMALPKEMSTDRFIRIVMTAIRNNKKLATCDGISVIAASMQSAALGLEPNTPLGHAYIIPYGNKANFQVGYKGLIDLALRTKQYRRINARSVNEADKFDFAYGLDEHLIHVPAQKPKGESIYFYAVYELDNGGKSFVVWSREQVEAHAKQYSKAYNTADSPWKSAFDAMAKKTVLIDLLRYAPKSVEISTAASIDNQAFTFNPDDPELHVDIISDYEVE